MRRTFAVPLTLMVLLIGACDSAPIGMSPLSRPLDSPLPTAIPLSTTVPIASSLPPTLTPWPTNTPTPLPTPTPTSTGIVPPSGLIYKTDYGLWRTDSMGQSVQLLAFDAQQASVILSPDAEQALYWDWNEGEIWLADLHTGERRNLTNSPTRWECCPTWWPAHPDTILFASQNMADRPVGATLLISMTISNQQLGVLDASGAFIAPAVLSPDGRVIAYSAYEFGQAIGQLYDGATTTLFKPEEYGVAGSRIVAPAYSPNGKHLAWMTYGLLDGEWQNGVGVFDLIASTARIFHPYKPVGRDGGQAPAIWSPDSRWIAVCIDADTGQGEDHAAWVIRVDGHGDEEHRVGKCAVAWSPDSQRLMAGLSLIEIGTWRSQPIALPREAQVIGWVTPSK